MTALDLDFVRAQFPAFSDPRLSREVFLENAGGSYACRQVIGRLTEFYTRRKVQPYGAFAASQEGGAEMDEAVSRLAAMLGVESDEVSVGPSTTQNTYVLAQAFRQTLKPGEAIIVTQQDHEANSGPWRRLAEDGIEVREWGVDPDTGLLETSRLEALLDDRVALVCFPHCSNIVGAVNPVADWCRLAHEVDAVACVDAVSYAPHGFVDVAAIGADIYLFSAYKTYGPHQGVMVIRRDLSDRLANQGHYFNSHLRPKRFTPAGPDHAQVAALGGIADYVDTLAAHHGGSGKGRAAAALVHDLQTAQERELLGPLLGYLKGRNDIRLLGPDGPAAKVGTVALASDRPAIEIAKALAGRGINAGGDHFYAVRLLEALGLDPEHGVVRLSLVHYTSRADIDRALEALDAVL